MTVAELIDALSEFPGDLRVRIAAWDRLTFEDVAEIRAWRDTPFDPEFLMITT